MSTSLPFEIDFAALLWIRAKNQPRELRPAGADQSRQPQDFPRPKLKPGILHMLLVGHVSHLQDDVTVARPSSPGRDLRAFVPTIISMMRSEENSGRVSSPTYSPSRKTESRSPSS